MIHHKQQISFRIVQTLVPGLETMTDENGVVCISERTAGDLLFSSNNEINKFCRDEKKTKLDVEELKRWMEVYHHVNLLLFPENECFTPYKAKHIAMAGLLEAGNIISLFEHLTEGTENSNKGVNFMYQQHSMRDGGFAARHVTSEFNDLFNSYLRAVELGMERDKISDLINFTRDPPAVSEEVMVKYLKICQTKLLPPQLELGKTTTGSLLRGMKFAFLAEYVIMFIYMDGYMKSKK